MPDSDDKTPIDAAAGSSGRNKDGLGQILMVSIALCLVCSIIVSTAAVSLKGQQQANKELDQKQNILRAAGLLPADSNVSADGKSADELFESFRVVAVDLNAGRKLPEFAVDGYDPIKAAKDPGQSRALSADEDAATIRRLENVSLVYLLDGPDGGLDKVVIPVRGYGLWGTLFGYLALEGDAQSIAGLGFYTHKETPGLGGEVDNSSWKALWNGVALYDSEGQPAVSLVKSRSPESSDQAKYEVDALSGATLTTRGVQNLVNFWTGDMAFGPYLQNIAAGNQG
ncbi:MAG: Na(+)-translocating NADH-quinone reductase subunit C [Pseudomonadales bacterium]